MSKKFLTRRIAIGCVILWQMSHAGYVIGETTTEYLPLTDGNFWTYSVTGTCGTYNFTVTVLQGTTTINGVPTKALYKSGGPDDKEVEYWTNDNNGIRLHGAYTPDTGIGPAWLYLEPPMVNARSTMTINETVTSNGKATFIFNYYGTFILNYESTSTIERLETVAVPAGTYETVKVRDSMRIFGSILNQPYDDTSTGNTWLAKDIGVVKETYIDVDCNEVSELISTNVKPPPTQLPARFLPFLPLLLD